MSTPPPIHPSVHRIPLAVFVLLLIASAAMAQDATPSQRAEFNKLANQRRELVHKLAALDRQAASKIKNDEKPVTLFAKQTAFQDKLDLVEQRMEILSVRYNLPMPAQPDAQDATDAERTARRIDKAFGRGRTRAIQQLRKDCLKMLGSLNFRSFLKNEG